MTNYYKIIKEASRATENKQWNLTQIKNTQEHSAPPEKAQANSFVDFNKLLSPK